MARVQSWYTASTVGGFIAEDLAASPRLSGRWRATSFFEAPEIIARIQRSRMDLESTSVRAAEGAMVAAPAHTQSYSQASCCDSDFQITSTWIGKGDRRS